MELVTWGEEGVPGEDHVKHWKVVNGEARGECRSGKIAARLMLRNIFLMTCLMMC